MEILIIGAIFFVIALMVRCKEAFQFRWQPTRHTWVAVGAGLLAFVFSASLLLFESGSVTAQLIHNGLIYVVCGAAIPWGYTVLVARETPSALGLKRERWVLSLILSLVVAGLFVPMLFFEGDLASVGWGNVAKASFVLTGAGGLFELFLYYGFIHLQLEKAFGTIPAILLTSAIYAVARGDAVAAGARSTVRDVEALLGRGDVAVAVQHDAQPAGDLALLPRRGCDAGFRGQHRRGERYSR
ncbi:MAG: hypothetical protein JXA14_00260 [Anaerolineae bacterium]|nr:hypothetical protein [Anaerolineae bacterium]